MKTFIKILPLIFFLALISCKKEKSIDEELKEAAATMNKVMPQVLNEGIRLDSVSAQPNKVFKYNYTLINDTKESVTVEEIEAFKKSAKEGTINIVKISPDMQVFRENGVTLKYFYHDKNRKPIADFTITAAEYGKK